MLRRGCYRVLLRGMVDCDKGRGLVWGLDWLRALAIWLRGGFMAEGSNFRVVNCAQMAPGNPNCSRALNAFAN